MFEYAKKIINAKIKEYEGHLDNNSQKLEAAKKIKDYIEEYKSSNFKKQSAKKDLITSAAMYILFAGCAIIVPYAASAVVFEILCGLLTIAIIFETKDLVSIINTIRVEYPDLVNLTEEELHKKELEADAEYEAQEAVICIIENVIESLKEPLNDFDEYLEYLNNPFYTAATEEEYKKEMSSRLEGNMLEDYLNEKVDYSKIHFNNKIGDEIDYTLKSKSYGKILK